MLDPLLAQFEPIVLGRYKEFRDAHDRLAARARWIHRQAATDKSLLIILGALSATKAVADQLLGAASVTSVVTFAVIGLLTATIAGFDAAFRFENRAGELSGLAAECAASMRELESTWQLFASRSPAWEVGAASASSYDPELSPEERRKEEAKERARVQKQIAEENAKVAEQASQVEGLLNSLNRRLNDIYTRAGKLGVGFSVPAEIRVVSMEEVMPQVGAASWAESSPPSGGGPGGPQPEE